ncbi:MAG TPA: hypothetical protein VIN40_05340 [Candidatus Tyrphobacter sp.]
MTVRTMLFAAMAALAACSSPTQSIDFQPPAGWTATPSLFGFQAWHTADSKQTLVLFRLPVAADPNTVMRQADINTAGTTTRKITICGKQPALLILGRGTRAHSQQNVEMVMTSYAGTTYMAIYARDIGLPLNAQADRAIHSLCRRS